MARLPVKTSFEHDPTCIVCLEEMEEARVLPCGHYFHAACLKNWMQEFDNCPTCRAKPDLEGKDALLPAPEQQPRPARAHHRTNQLRAEIADLIEYQQEKRNQQHLARQIAPPEHGIEEACWLEFHDQDQDPPAPEDPDGPEAPALA